MMVPDSKRLRAAEFRWDTNDAFRRELRSFFNLHPKTGKDNGFAFDEWPRATLFPGYPQVERQRVRVMDGKVQADAKEGAAILAGALWPELGKNAPLDWFLARVPVMVIADQAESEVVRKALASLLAADLKTGKPDRRVQRARLQKSWQSYRQASTDDLERLLVDVHVQALAQLPAKQFEELFAAEGRLTTVDGTPQSGLYAASWRYAQTLAAKSPDRFQDPQGDVRERIDPTLPVRVLVPNVGLPTVRLPFARNRGFFDISLQAAPPPPGPRPRIGRGSR